MKVMKNKTKALPLTFTWENENEVMFHSDLLNRQFHITKDIFILFTRIRNINLVFRFNSGKVNL